MIEALNIVTLVRQFLFNAQAVSVVRSKFFKVLKLSLVVTKMLIVHFIRAAVLLRHLNLLPSANVRAFVTFVFRVHLLRVLIFVNVKTLPISTILFSVIATNSQHFTFHQKLNLSKAAVSISVPR